MRKKTLRASEQDRADVAAGRVAWRDEAAAIDPERFVLLDESGCDTRPAHGCAPGGHWRRLTLIGALSLDGLCAAMLVGGATSTAVFLAFVTQGLIPALQQRRPDAVVVMDNLAAPRLPPCARPWTQPGSPIAICPPNRPARTRLNAPGRS